MSDDINEIRGDCMIKNNIFKYFVLYLLVCFCLVNTKLIAKANEQTNLLDQSIVEDIEPQFYDNNNEAPVVNSKIKLDKLINIICSILIEIIGAFLGFLFAIAFANRSDKQRVKELDSSLYNELEKIYKELGERLKEQELEDYYCYQTTIWDISLASGTLALVTNSEIYQKYIQIYSMIQYAQNLESGYVHARLLADTYESGKFVKGYIHAIGNARKREAKNIYEHIEEYILREVDKCQEKQ